MNLIKNICIEWSINKTNFVIKYCCIRHWFRRKTTNQQF